MPCLFSSALFFALVFSLVFASLVALVLFSLFLFPLFLFPFSPLPLFPLFLYLFADTTEHARTQQRAKTRRTHRITHAPRLTSKLCGISCVWQGEMRKCKTRAKTSMRFSANNGRGSGGEGVSESEREREVEGEGREGGSPTAPTNRAEPIKCARQPAKATRNVARDGACQHDWVLQGSPPDQSRGSYSAPSAVKHGATDRGKGGAKIARPPVCALASSHK